MNYDQWLAQEQERADAELDELNGLYNRFNVKRNDEDLADYLQDLADDQGF